MPPFIFFYREETRTLSSLVVDSRLIACTLFFCCDRVEKALTVSLFFWPKRFCLTGFAQPLQLRNMTTIVSLGTPAAENMTVFAVYQKNSVGLENV